MSKRKIGRDAKTGRFTTIKKAEEQKDTHIVETIGEENNERNRDQKTK